MAEESEVKPSRKTTKSKGSSEDKKISKDVVHQLDQALADLPEDSQVALFTHRMPDPDAISSMMAMKWFLDRKYGLDAEMFYEGEVAHPQNTVMCNLLDPGMKRVTEFYRSNEFAFRMLVDTVPEAAGVGGLDITFDCVIDHHRVILHDYEGILIHRKVGSCASIIYEIIKKLLVPNSEKWFDDDIDYDSNISTALIVGIMTDCNYMLSDDTTESERIAFNELFEYRNSNFLHQIIFYKKPKFWIVKKADGCKEYDVDEEGCAIVGLGIIPEKQRDLLADMAEEMVSWVSVETAIAFGVVGGDRIEGSVRSLNASENIPELCKELGGKHGSGGGKHGKGAYRLPLAGMSIDPDEDEEDIKEVWDTIKKRERKRIRRVTKK